jgi:flagellin
MPQIINTNISSLNAQRNLDKSQSAQDTALQRLSSGLRINSAKDDAAGIAIANRLDAQVKGLSVASRNAGDGVSLSQIAEGSIESISTSLQRLRELAVQSSNATNGDSERVALNQEAQQLIEEIERTSASASFNGVNLLDGTFQGKSFQVGANVGDEVNVSLGSVSTSALGTAETAGISGSVSKTALVAGTTNLDLVAGDLVINGASIGASTSDSDTSSRILGASSSIAKAAAINAASDITGVTATVTENNVEGTALATVAANAAANVTINGTTFSLTTAVTTDLSGTASELGKVADVINAKSDLTGVTASVVATETAGGASAYRVDLTAADGRNVDIVEAADSTIFGLAAGGAAAATAQVYVGDVTLSSVDGSDIVIGSDTGNIDNAGFEEGTFGGNVGGLQGDSGLIANRAALQTGDLVINGAAISPSLASDDVASSASNSASAIAKAAAINKASDATGVTAEASANTLYSGDITVLTAGALTVNGVSVTIAAGTDVGQKVTNAIDAINAVVGQTGVKAEALDANSYKLIAEDGRNIVLGGGGAANDEGFVDSTNVAGITLTSGGKIDLSSDTGNIERAGFNVGTFGGSESGTLLKDVDISTADGAKAAITAVDNALNSVNSERAKLGSIQSRFESVISANAIAIENFSASASRIKDADFAAETAALSRAQVLQQAGISVLAQANARPQQVLSLLQ